MKIRETVVIQLALASVLPFLAKASTVIYRNDFTVRTSSAPIPATNVWHEATPYRTNNGLVAFRPTTGDGLAAYEQLSSRGAYYNSAVYASRPVVDGWFIPFFNYRSAYTLFSDVDKCAIGTDGAYKHSPVIVFDKDNPALTFAYGSTARRAGVILHSLHNSFTNGQLRIQVDMRAPERWASGYSYMRVFPVYDAYMDILAWKGSWCDRDQNKNENASITNSPVTPGKFGIRSTAGKITTEEGATRSYPQYYDVRNLNSGTTQVGNNYGTAFNYWHRFVVTYDLDNAKFGGTVYRIKQDVGHPTLETEMVSENIVAAAKDFSNALWQNCATNAQGVLTTDLDALWRTKGGISGIGVDAIGSFNTLGYTVTNKLVVDNFRISWKAPGADDFEVFYENDFHTRRYRTLSAAARTTEATYAPATVTTNAPRTYVYSVAGDLEKDRLMPLLTSPNDKAQPVGIDGWRVLPYADVNGSPNSHAGVLKYGGNAYDAGGEGGNMLTFGNQGSWGLVGQTLGASYTTGKVRIVADVRLPLGGLNTWHVNTRRASIGLGSTALYSANRDQLAANLAAGIGYLREVKTVDDAAVTNDVPYCLGTSQTDATPSFTFEENPDIPEKATWYRYDVTADLAKKTYDATITPIGTASVLPDFTLTNDAIYSVSSVPFAANVSDVGSFYLRFFGYGNANSASYINRRVCFDNIRVYHIEPAAEEGGEETATLVYENTFDTCTRSTGENYVRAAGYVAEQYDRDDGPDHWIRRNGSGVAAFQATATVRDDNGNQYLALGREDDGGTRVQVSHTFGQYLTHAFRFRVDMRPPDAWGSRNGFATVGLGSAQMEQTEIAVGDFDAGRHVAFGFSNTVANASCPYYNPTTGAFALGVDGGMVLGSGQPIDPSHWYRFSVAVNPEAGTYAVRVHDMGAAHPGCDAPAGALVARQDGIPFLNALGGDGIGAFYIHAYGVRGTHGVSGVDEGNVMVDNIVAEAIQGCTISIR